MTSRYLIVVMSVSGRYLYVILYKVSMKCVKFVSTRYLEVCVLVTIQRL